MKLVTFLPPGTAEPLAGEIRGDQVVAFDDGSTVAGRLRSGDREPAGGAAHPLDGVTLLAPHVPRAIFGIGLNYRAHAAEQGRDLPETPIVFMKLPSSIAPPGGPVRGERDVRAGHDGQGDPGIGAQALQRPARSREREDDPVVAGAQRGRDGNRVRATGAARREHADGAGGPVGQGGVEHRPRQ